MRILFSILFLALLHGALPAQPATGDYIARNYLLQDRLADGLTFDVMQDRQGFLWFATEFGLVKYDGHSLKTYRHVPGDEGSLADNVTTSLAEDATGNLWVGTMNGGLHRFNPRMERFDRFQYDAVHPGSLGSNKVNEILVRQNGQVWVTTMAGVVKIAQVALAVLLTATPQTLWPVAVDTLVVCGVSTSDP